MHKILIVEDDADIAELLKVNLQDLEFDCELCQRGDTALARITRTHYDLVILDLGLPGMTGLEVCQRVRQEKPQQPILMLTAKSSDLDQIIGLEVGADDYVTKPFSVPALQARVRARIRRSELMLAAQESDGQSSKEIQVGELLLQPQSRRAFFCGQRLALTAREFELLKYFASHPEQVFSRTQLLDAVWGYNHDGYEHTVNSHINRLRNKLLAASGDKSIIRTVWGVGYSLNREECS